MGFMETLLGRKPAPPKARHSKPPASMHADSQQGGPSFSVRRDLLKLTLRETLTRNGIPPMWIAADMLRSTNARKESGVHVRFQLRHWEPRLLAHTVALEHEFTQRLLLLDPLARNWLMGFSWQFALEDDSRCPALPHPGTWTAAPDPSMPAALATEPAALGSAASGASAGVIEGPALAPRALDDVRADLERLLALRDEDMRKHAEPEQAFAPTRPATL